MLAYLGIIFGIIGQKYSGSAKKHNRGGGGGGIGRIRLCLVKAGSK